MEHPKNQFNFGESSHVATHYKDPSSNGISSQISSDLDDDRSRYGSDNDSGSRSHSEEEEEDDDGEELYEEQGEETLAEYHDARPTTNTPTEGDDEFVNVIDSKEEGEINNNTIIHPIITFGLELLVAYSSSTLEYSQQEENPLYIPMQ